MSAGQRRIWYAVTATIACSGLLIQVLVVATAAESRWSTVPARVFNVFCYFTIESNLLVAMACLLLAARPDRGSTAFQTVRMTGLVGITITGLVYHVAIAHLVEFDGWALVADQITHTVVPVAAVAGWLVLDARGLLTRRVVALVPLYMVAYMTFTLVRGAIVDWYPYHFADVGTLGYGRVIVNGAWVTLLFLAVTAAFAGIDAWLARLR